MEEKFYKRFQSFKNSLDALSEARVRNLEDSFVLSGTGAKFTITMDLSWKVMKDIIVQYHMISDFPIGSPREVLRKAFETGLIDDEIWVEKLQVRNKISEEDDGKILKKYCEKIVGIYIEIFEKFRDKADIIVKEVYP